MNVCFEIRQRHKSPAEVIRNIQAVLGIKTIQYKPAKELLAYKF